MRVKEKSEKFTLHWLKFNIKKTKIMVLGPTTSWQIEGGKNGSSDIFYIFWLQNHCGWWLQPWNSKILASWKRSYDKPRQCIKKKRHQFANKGPYSQSYGFSSSYIRMWELNHREDWSPKFGAFKLWCWRRLESPLDWKDIKSFNPKGNKSWLFTGRTNAEAEAPVFWPPGEKSRLVWKDPDAGKDWRQEEKGRTGNEMVEWHHRLNRHKFENTPGDGERQKSLVCCSLWGCKELDTTDWLNNNNHWMILDYGWVRWMPTVL